jgi:hypothetical protein
VTTSTTEPASAGPQPAPKLHWWREVLYVLAFYALYTVVRDVHGTRPVSLAHAYGNAKKIIRLEQAFGLFQERRIQSLFLHSHFIVRAFDDYYGSAHFIMTFIALVYLFRRQPQRYPLWRNTLAITTGLALIGFALFPLMPPRLLPSSYHIVDTLRTIGGLWSFNSGPVNAVSNQYAAMPSLHTAWSLWCALVLAPAAKHRVVKALLWCYPVVTVLCIVVTGNHYIADAVGGALTLGVGYLGARVLTRMTRKDAANTA